MLCWSSREEILRAQGKGNPSKMVGVARGHQRADTLKPYSQKTSQSNHTSTTALSNSMKPRNACGATQDGRVMVERSDRMWSTGEGNGKPLQYSCLENPMNSMKRQNDRILKEELPRSVGAHTDNRCVELSQDVAAADDDIVLILQQKLEGLQEGQLMLFFSFFVHFLICFRQLFDGKYGVGVGNQTDDCVDNSDHSPANHTAAEPVHCEDSNSFNDDLGCKCEDEARGLYC